MDANLRAGPGTEFTTIGGTITGQPLTIVGRNADATWYRLDNTGWIFANLVANPPAASDVPVVNADGTPVEAPVPTATPQPAPSSGSLFPTPTPLPAGAAASNATTVYVAAANRTIDDYDRIVTTLDGLIAQASTDSAQLANANWIKSANDATALVRQTGAAVGELQAPAGFEAVQEGLAAAAAKYTEAAIALDQAAQTAAVAQLSVADTAIEGGNTSLAAAETALAAAGQ
ncbi:MAG: SH3 domain-containing protein [Anaerolineales bacterium]|nr:SH3 domain-containing protein [Anaerolineales bacterium]